MTLSLEGCRRKTKQLEEHLKDDQEKHRQFSVQMTQDLQNCEVEAKRRAEEDKAEVDALSNRVAHFMTLTSSYIQSLYEQCLTQERMISLEDPSLLSIHSSNSKFHRSTSMNKKKVNHVIDRLENSIESMHVDWEGILCDDNDRRIVYGNLNNRSQINNSQIDNLIKRIKQRQKSELDSLQLKNSQALNALKSNYQSEISSLNKQIYLTERKLKDLNATLNESKNDLSIARAEIGNLVDTKEKNEVEMDALEKALAKSKHIAEELQGKLVMVSKVCGFTLPSISRRHFVFLIISYCFQKGHVTSREGKRCN